MNRTALLAHLADVERNIDDLALTQQMPLTVTDMAFGMCQVIE